MLNKEQRKSLQSAIFFLELNVSLGNHYDQTVLLLLCPNLYLHLFMGDVCGPLVHAENYTWDPQLVLCCGEVLRVR